MPETIDLTTLHQAKRELQSFTHETGQPTDMTQMDLEPLRQIQKIEIGEEFITITYNETITYRYNVKEVTHKVWECKYNNDPEIVRAIGQVIKLARKHLRDLPTNLACPPGCAQCCSGYEPFVNKEDVERISQHLGISVREVMNEYVVQRPSADGFVVGYLRKISDDTASQCIFLKGKESGKYYCGIYTARPHDCRAFTPIGCQDVDSNLPFDGPQPNPRPFQPRHAKTTPKSKRKSAQPRL